MYLNSIVYFPSSFLSKSFTIKEFKTKTQLDNHVEKHNNDNDPQKPKSKFQCNQCDKISPNSNALYSHIRQVHCESKYKCHLCTKSFKLEDSLKVWLKLIELFLSILENTIFRNSLIVIGVYSFRHFFLHLQDHISMHLKSKNYKCTYCDQAFVWRSNMYKHRKQLHRKEWLSEKMKDTN